MELAPATYVASLTGRTGQRWTRLVIPAPLAERAWRAAKVEKTVVLDGVRAGRPRAHRGAGRGACLVMAEIPGTGMAYWAQNY